MKAEGLIIGLMLTYINAISDLFQERHLSFHVELDFKVLDFEESVQINLLISHGYYFAER